MGGGMPEHICETEPASAAPCPLCVHVVRTDGSYTKTPQANRSNFQKASQAQHGERDSVREREDKGMLENLSFQYYHGYEPKSQEALSDFKVSVKFKSNSPPYLCEIG